MSAGRLDFVLGLIWSPDNSEPDEQQKMWVTGEGTHMLVARRVVASRAAMSGRLSLLRHFIEEMNLAVNTITPEEAALIEEQCDRIHWVVMLTTPFSLALCGHQKEVANYLMDRMKREEVDTRDGCGRTCLMMASRENNPQAVRRLLHLGADIHASDDGEHKALCFASEKGHAAVVDVLLEHAKALGGRAAYQAMLKEPCPCRDLPLVYDAIRDNRLPLIEYLKEKECQDILYQRSTLKELEAECYPHQYAAYTDRFSNGSLPKVCRWTWPPMIIK